MHILLFYIEIHQKVSPGLLWYSSLTTFFIT